MVFFSPFKCMKIAPTKPTLIEARTSATIKVGFVGAIFMHLKGEKKTIWRPLYFTAFFVLGLFLLTLLHWYDPIFSTLHNEH